MSCREVSRFSEANGSLQNLDRPSGTEFVQCRSMHGPKNWNMMVRKMLVEGHEWIFCTEDDHIYPPDSLARLLDSGKDIISGLYLKRDLPFEPIAYHELNDGTGNFTPHYLTPRTGGITEVDVVGVGCLLIRRRVFETVPPAFVGKNGPGWWTLTAPPSDPDEINSDTEWCRYMKKHGQQIWCDFDLPIGHVAVVPIAPIKQRNGQWQTLLVLGLQNGLMVDQEQPKTSLVIAR